MTNSSNFLPAPLLPRSNMSVNNSRSTTNKGSAVIKNSQQSRDTSSTILNEDLITPIMAGRYLFSEQDKKIEGQMRAKQFAFVYPDASRTGSTQSKRKQEAAYKPMMSKILTPVTFAKVLLKTKQQELKQLRQSASLKQYKTVSHFSSKENLQTTPAVLEEGPPPPRRNYLEEVLPRLVPESCLSEVQFPAYFDFSEATN